MFVNKLGSNKNYLGALAQLKCLLIEYSVHCKDKQKKLRLQEDEERTEENRIE